MQKRARAKELLYKNLFPLFLGKPKRAFLQPIAERIWDKLLLDKIFKIVWFKKTIINIPKIIHEQNYNEIGK